MSSGEIRRSIEKTIDKIITDSPKKFRDFIIKKLIFEYSVDELEDGSEDVESRWDEVVNSADTWHKFCFCMARFDEFVDKNKNAVLLEIQRSNPQATELNELIANIKTEKLEPLEEQLAPVKARYSELVNTKQNLSVELYKIADAGESDQSAQLNEQIAQLDSIIDEKKAELDSLQAEKDLYETAITNIQAEAISIYEQGPNKLSNEEIESIFFKTIKKNKAVQQFISECSENVYRILASRMLNAIINPDSNTAQPNESNDSP